MSRTLCAQMIFRQSVLQEGKTLFRRVDDLEKFQVGSCNRPCVDHDLKIDQAFPVFPSINDHQNLLRQFLGLRQGEDFEEFVHGSEAAGKNHQRLGQIREPELAHEEVVKVKIQGRRDVGVGILFEGQANIQANRL